VLLQFFHGDVAETVIAARRPARAPVHLDRDHALGGAPAAWLAVSVQSVIWTPFPHLDVRRVAFDAGADRVPLALLPVFLPVPGPARP